MTELFLPLAEQKNGFAQAEFFLATIGTVYTDGVKIIPDGETEQTQKPYRTMASAYPAPKVGDRVVVMRHSGTCVVLGRIDMPIGENIYTTNIPSICTGSSDFTVTAAYYHQVGQVASVRVDGTWTRSTSSADYFNAFTMVQGKRPRIASMARAWRNANAILYPNGVMEWWGTLTNGNTATFISTYLI